MCFINLEVLILFSINCNLGHACNVTLFCVLLVMPGVLWSLLIKKGTDQGVGDYQRCTGTSTRVAPCRPTSGSKQSIRIVRRCQASLTRTRRVSPSPIEATVAALAGSVDRVSSRNRGS